MAAVSKKLIWLIAFASATAIATESNNQQVTEDEVIAYLNKQIIDQITHVGQTIENCDKIKAKTQINVTPDQLNQHFKASGLTWKDTIAAVGYIGMRNSDLCSHQARADLVFKATALEEMMTKAGHTLKIHTLDGEYTHGELWNMALLPVERGYKYAVMYGRLPTDIQTYMEKQFSTAPFDYLRFIEKLPRE